MQVGSLVECVSNYLSHPWSGILPVIGNIYTIRATCEVFGQPYVRVEEIIQPIDMFGEYWMCAQWFRELQPPMSLEFINELQNQTV